MREKFGQEAQAITFNHPGGFQTGFMVGEAFFRGQAGQPDIDARQLRPPIRIEHFDFAMTSDRRIEQDYVNVVVVNGIGGGTELAKGATFEARFGFSGVGH